VFIYTGGALYLYLVRLNIFPLSLPSTRATFSVVVVHIATGLVRDCDNQPIIKYYVITVVTLKAQFTSIEVHRV